MRLSPPEKHRVVENLLTNWVPLSLKTDEGVPYNMTQLFNSIVATCIEFILAVEIICVSLDNWPAIAGTG